jgi:hypothetical protein
VTRHDIPQYISNNRQVSNSIAGNMQYPSINDGYFHLYLSYKNHSKRQNANNFTYVYSQRQITGI